MKDEYNALIRSGVVVLDRGPGNQKWVVELWHFRFDRGIPANTVELVLSFVELKRTREG